MKFDKHTLGKRFSKFLTKLFWHFNQSVPDYSSFNNHSADKYRANSDHYRRSKTDKSQERTLYPVHYRMRQRTSTLMSIQEENETELMNCK